MSLGTMEQRTEGIKREAQELIEQAYQKGYNAGYEEGKFSASEAIEKLRAYEEQEEDKEIHVGDEVILNVTSSWDKNTKAIIIADEKTLMFPYNVMISSGDTDWVDRNDIKCKTGRHFPEIVEVLKKMQEGK